MADVLAHVHDSKLIAPLSRRFEVVGSYCEDHGPWGYTTVFAFEKPGHEVHPKANDDESMEIVWVPIDEVPDRRLLTAMRTDWPSFEKRLRALAAEHKGE